MEKKFVFSSDLQYGIKNSKVFYETLLDICGKEKTDLVLGGDIFPNHFKEKNCVYVSEDIRYQRDFIDFYLLNYFKRFKKQTKKDLYLMMGNDDFSKNMDLLEKSEKNNLIKLLHNKVHKFCRLDNEEIFISGYGFVPITGGGIKDWDKFDDKFYIQSGAEYEGTKSSIDFEVKQRFFPDDRKDNIENDFEKIALRDKKRINDMIYVIHSPPYGTNLDLNGHREHCGSGSIKYFIEKHQPLLTLHGHIHESPIVSGEFQEKIGKTVCVNVGQEKETLHYALIEISDKKKIKVKGFVA